MALGRVSKFKSRDVENDREVWHSVCACVSLVVLVPIPLCVAVPHPTRPTRAHPWVTRSNIFYCHSILTS